MTEQNRIVVVTIPGDEMAQEANHGSDSGPRRQEDQDLSAIYRRETEPPHGVRNLQRFPNFQPLDERSQGTVWISFDGEMKLVATTAVMAQRVPAATDWRVRLLKKGSGGILTAGVAIRGCWSECKVVAYGDTEGHGQPRGVESVNCEWKVCLRFFSR